MYEALSYLGLRPLGTFVSGVRGFELLVCQVDAARFEVPDSFFEVTAGDVRVAMAAAKKNDMVRGFSC